jgi:hypothetical protein
MTVLSAALPRRRRDVPAPESVRPPTGGRDRRALVAVSSLVVICASVAAFAGLYSSAGHKTAAVVVERALVQGQPVTAAQLGQADVSVSSGVAFIPVAAGSLLTPGDLTSAPTVAAGSAVVGLALKDGQFPASGVVPGETVMIVQTATPGSPLSAPVTGSPTSTSGSASGVGTTVFSGSGTGVLVARATVYSASAPSANASGGFAVLVSVEVLSAIAPDVATAASAGQVSLVLLAQGASTPPPAGAPA